MNTLSLVAAEGAAFGFLALAILISFHWVRFPDLTPDGSFALGAVGAVLFFRYGGESLLLALTVAFLLGFVTGLTTAAVHAILKVPSMIAGLLVATGLYSVSWLLMQRPNISVPSSAILFQGAGLYQRAAYLALGFGLALVVVSALLFVFMSSVWGVRVRAVRENPLLEAVFSLSDRRAAFVGLGLANAIAALAGALYTQRTYSADVNMGIGITIAGLAAVSLGRSILGRLHPSVARDLLAAALGAALFKSCQIVALELGLPAPIFRLLTAALLLGAFLPFPGRDTMLEKLRWA